MHSRCDDRRLSVSRRDRSPGKDQVRELGPEKLTAVGNGLGGLVDGLRLSGQSGVVDPHVEGFDETRVCGDRVALLQKDDIARHEIGSRHFLLCPVAQHPGVLGEQFLKRLERPLGLVLLPETEDRVDDDDAEDRPAELGHVRDKGKNAAYPEQEREEARKIFDEPENEGLPPHLFQEVRTVAAEPFRSLAFRKPAAVRSQLLVDVLDGEGEKGFLRALFVVEQKTQDRLACPGPPYGVIEVGVGKDCRCAGKDPEMDLRRLARRKEQKEQVNGMPVACAEINALSATGRAGRPVP